MMKKVIITGHGNYATGLKSSLDLLAGSNEDVIAIDFPAELNEQGLMKRMMDTVETFSDFEFLFICDILGGTPYKNAAVLANTNHRLEVVAGCNLGSILEGILQKDMMSLDELAEAMVNSSRKYTVKFEKIIESAAFDGGITEEDGI